MMAPLANTRTIPLGWSEHHTAAAEGAMNATVEIGKPGAKTHDPDTDETSQQLEQVYVGPARIEEMNQARAAEWAGQEVAGRAYLVQLTFEGAEIQPGMRLDVLTAPNDPHLVGDTLWVLDFRKGSERFTRDIVCSDTQQAVPPVGQGPLL